MDNLEETPMSTHTSASRAPLPPKPTRSLKLIGVVAVVVAIGIAANGILGRDRSDATLAKWTADQAVPTVAVIVPKAGTGGQQLVLPGDVEAYFEAPIYARVNGYVKIWYQDIGAHVKAGQVLADIDTPDLDQQLAQAQASLGTAKADAALANLTAKRWQALQSTDAVSQQSVDERTGEAAAKKANVEAAAANVRRLEAMEGFKRITAPFDGVVTVRKTDIGALINAGSSAGHELFKVADIHKMRVYVRVPQAMAAGLKDGMTASLHLPQYPNKTFDAVLTNTSNAVSKDSRSLLVELQVENKDGQLWPGTFAEVHFNLPDDPHILHVPTSALLFRKEGMEVATVGADGKIVLKPVELGRDLGTDVEIRSGLAVTDKVVDNPSDSIAQGDIVRVAAASEKTEAKAPPAQQDKPGAAE